MSARALRAGAAAALAAATLVIVGEWLGWPFLAAPAQRWASRALQREVVLLPAQPGDDTRRPSLRLFGGLTVHLPRLEVAAPDWSDEPYMVRAEDVQLRLRYRDLWAAYRGRRLHVHRLEVGSLDARIERPDAGRASWQFGASPGQASGERPPPSFGHLAVGEGRIAYTDVPRELAFTATATLRDGPTRTDPASPAHGLRLEARGRYADADFELRLDSDAILPWIDADGSAPPTAARLQARSEGIAVRFDGTTRDVLRLDDLSGRFEVEGASMSRLGDALGVTLPTTGPIRLAGTLHKEEATWSVTIEQARVGASRLNGRFRYDRAAEPPLLAGRLGGEVLRFADLAPVVGASVPGVTAPARQGRMIPAREFDLPSLLAMDADVRIDIDSVDLGPAFGEPLRPLRAQLRLKEGTLAVADLVARTSQGRVGGRVELHGRPDPPEWRAHVDWSGIALEHWIRQSRPKGRPPWLSGRLAGRLDVSGRGRSTAQVLAGLQGEAVLRLREGRASHLAVEIAGIDLFESLGLVLQGDQSLPVDCAVGHWVVSRGIARPRVMVIDTPDSTIWIDGEVSLADERLALRAAVSPKDSSPLSLRTPLQIRGSFVDPQVSLEKGPLASRLALAGLLAALQPVASLLAGLDPGGSEGAGGEAGCKRLIELSGVPAVRQPRR
ncbi:MAG: AsmA family protein [Burkholderiaceae bacterium]|nr:AsmA family protein [Burkholderiaceae bacterium]